jgi:hypothetical protein
MNGFADCKVYILVYGEDGDTGAEADIFTIDLDALLDPTRVVSAFFAPRMMATIVLAEKGPNSTSHVRPSQQHYRSVAEWTTYRENLAKIKQSTRHHLVRTQHPISFEDVRGGHLFLADDFTARDPWTEILKKRAQEAPIEIAPTEIVPTPKPSIWRTLFKTA